MALATGVEFGNRNAVQPQRLSARLPDADQRRGLVLEREALRRLEGEAKLRVNEPRPAHDALGRIVAESEAVDRREIGVPASRAHARRAELPRLGDRLSDALWRRGMRGHHVWPVRRACPGDRRAKRAPLPERCKKARRGVGVEARIGNVFDADLVSLELLLAGKAGDGEPRARFRLVSRLLLAENLRIDPGEQRRGFRKLGPLRRMAGGYVRDLVRHDRSDLGGVLGEREKATSDEYVAGRQGESVDDRRIEERHPIGLSRRAGGRRKLREHVIEITFCRGRIIFAAKRVDEPLAFGTDRRAARGGGRGGDGRLADRPGRRVDRGASRQPEAKGGYERRKRAAPPSDGAGPSAAFPGAFAHWRGFSARGVSPRRTISIIAGSLTSILGPIRSSSAPRARIVFPSSASTGRPA